MSELTVVIATYTRTDLLRELIDALSSQTVPVDIIISDDGSNPFSLQENHRGVVRYLWANRDGGYHRVLRFNEGVMLARTKYVALLDDDCLPVSKDWSAAHLTALQSCDIVRGVFLDSGAYGLAPWFSSINLSMLTRTAQALGPFDMAYDGNYGHEDLDLGKTVASKALSVQVGGNNTAVTHRGVARHEYHIGYDKNVAYFKKKWGEV